MTPVRPTLSYDLLYQIWLLPKCHPSKHHLSGDPVALMGLMQEDDDDDDDDIADGIGLSGSLALMMCCASLTYRWAAGDVSPLAGRMVVTRSLIG